jgi:DNA-binding IclR family transcriptional regulator
VSERILDVIEAFSERRTPLVLTELAAQIGAPKSSCFELVQVLKKRGYLYALGRRRGFYPTRRLFTHAKIIVENDPLLGRLDGMVKNLRNVTGETVIVGKRQDDEVVYLDVAEGLHTIRYSATAGDCKPLHSSAIGKAMLGQLDERQLAALLDRMPLEKITPETIVDRGALESDIASGRRHGYFVTRGENVADVMACARAIDFAGVSYGIAVAGPLHRMKMMEAKIAADLLAACGNIDEVP